LARLVQSLRALTAQLARHREAEARLRETEQRYRRLFTYANVAVLIYDPRTTRILQANRAAAQLLGYAQRELTGQSLQDMAPDPVAFRRYVRTVLRCGRVANLETVRCRQDGTLFVASVNAAVIHYAGRPVILSVLRDVTAARQAEATLRTSLQRLHAARDASLDAFYVEECVRDTRGRIVDFRFVDLNRRAAQLLRRRRQDLIGRRLCELYPEARTRGFFKRFVKVVETGRPLVEVFATNNDAVTAKWLHQQVVRLGDGIAITARDITREKRDAQQQRQFSWRMLKGQETDRRRVARDLHDGVGQLLATARFHLQSAGVGLGRAERTARRDVGDATRAVATALEEVRRISHNLRPAELDDLGFVAAVRSLCREFARATRLKLTLRCKLRRLPSPGVGEALYRIVQESLNNVQRHARARTVSVRLGERDGGVWLRVADDGRGFKFDAQATAGHGAIGIGLRNIQERAALAGGAFACRTAPGRGTELFVQMPFDADHKML
jgi:PAS domain S-box-containing protein